MKLKKTSSRSHGTLNELNITPLLDLVFVLLVIFIITTPQMMNNLEMTLPSGKAPQQKPNEPKPKINRILVNAKGESFLDGEIFATVALKEKLKSLKSSNSDLRVVVKAEDEADYQSMVTVLDVLQQLDITKVGLATEAEGN
ncbi:MAG: outer rane transport energization protein ExbD [Verrucomicrobiales bacterium]|nr:outer rane transport energization protein ExbD [Verrucomicrobiales bacterium]